MAFEFPTLTEVVERMQNDVQAQLPESNPFLDNSFIKAFITSSAGQFEEFYLQLNSVFEALFLSSTSGEFVDKWGAIYGIDRLAATKSTGTVNFSGNIGSAVPINTFLQDSQGNQYQTDNDIVIALSSTSGIAANVSGEVVTVTQTAHNFAPGLTITVSNAGDNALNGPHVITAVIDADTYTYDAPGATVSGPVVGLIIDANTASITVTAVESGDQSNVAAGATVTLISALPGIDSQAYVQLGGIAGGADVETDQEYRDRIFDRLANPIAEFSQSDIISQIKDLKLSDETVVLSPHTITPIANSPAPGQVFIVVSIVDKSNDTLSAASASEILLMAQAIDEIVPANIVSPLITNTSAGNVWITPPLAYPAINVVISSLSPDPDSMKQAIESNLEAYFVDVITVSQDTPEFGFTQSVTFNEINAVIQTSIDPNTGKQPESFTMTINGGTIDIPVAQLERPVLGTVTFA